MSKAWSAKNKSENVQDFKAKEDTYASRNTNGTGPYILKLWEPDKRIVMQANPAWWDKIEGNVTEVIYTPIKSDATRVAALLAGDVDLLTDLPTQDVARMQQGPEAQGARRRREPDHLHRPGPVQQRAEVLGRQGQEPVQGRARAQGAQRGGGPRGDPARHHARPVACRRRSWSRPSVHGHSADIDKVSPVDVEGAKKLLAEAGYPNGFSFQLDCPNNRYVNDEEICQALVGMWAGSA